MSETAAIVAALRRGPMCLDCVTQQGAVLREAVELAPAAISRLLVVQRDNGTCRACGSVGPILGWEHRR